MTAQQYFDLGLDFFDKENFEEAIKHFSLAESAAENTIFPKASFKKGALLQTLGRNIEALESYEKAEKDSEPYGYPDASTNKGVVLETLGITSKAFESYEKAEKDGGYYGASGASYNKALLLYKNGRTDEAIKAFEKAEKDNGESGYPLASYNKGVILRNNNKFDEAIKAFEKAEKDSGESGYPLASYNKGVILGNNNKFDEAIKAFEKAEKDGGIYGYPDASSDKGVILARLDRIMDALEAYEKAEKDSGLNGFPKASSNKGTLLQYMGRDKEALNSYEKAEKDSGENGFPLASSNKGVLLKDLGRVEDALIAFEKAEKDGGLNGWPVASYNKGLLLENLGRFDEAFESYEKAEKNEGLNGYPDASYSKGALIFKYFQKREAILSFQRGIYDFIYNPSNYQKIDIILPKLYFACYLYYVAFNKHQKIIEYHRMFFEAINNLPINKETDHLKSQMYCLQGELQLTEFAYFSAKTNFLKALSYNENNRKALDMLIQHFDDDPAYRSRKDYLDFLLLREVIQSKHFGKNAFTLLQVCDLFHHSDDKMLQYIELLIHEEDVLKKGDKAIRLREAYLLAASSEYWHIVFYIIDNLLDDGDYSLDQLDQYFYVLSAAKIGEPKSSLQSISVNLDFEVNIVHKNEYLCEVQIGKELSKAMGKTKLEKNMISSILNNQPIEITIPATNISKILTTAYLPTTYDEIIEENLHLKSFRRELHERAPNFNDLAEYIDEIITSRDIKVLGSVLKLIREKMKTKKEVKEYHLLMAYALWVHASFKKVSPYEEVVKEELIATYFEGILISAVGYIVTASVFVSLVSAVVVNLSIRKYKEYKGFKKLTWEEFIS